MHYPLHFFSLFSCLHLRYFFTIILVSLRLICFNSSRHIYFSFAAKLLPFIFPPHFLVFLHTIRRDYVFPFSPAHQFRFSTFSYFCYPYTADTHVSLGCAFKQADAKTACACMHERFEASFRELNMYL